MKNLNEKSRSVWDMLAQLTTVRARPVLLVAGAIGLISAFGASRLRPVASIAAMLGDDEPAAIALKRITEHFSGMEELIVLASAPQHTPVSDDRSASLVAFAERLRGEVSSSPHLSGMCDQVNFRPSPDLRAFSESVVVPKAMHYLDDDAVAELSDWLTPERMRDQLARAEELISSPGAAGGALSRAALKDPLGLREFLVTALPSPAIGASAGFAASDGLFSADRRHLIIRLRGTEPASDLEFAGAFTEAVTDAARTANKDGLTIALTGAYAIAAESHRAIRGDMIRSITLSIIFLQVLYLIAYRNLWALPAALVPVSLGILVAFALAAALGMSLTPMTAVIGAILAGLGIDYSIHSLSHYRSDRAGGLTHEAAIRSALSNIAPALMAACVTTVVGFLAIAQSSVRALREFGLLGAMGLIASLLAAIIVLPALLTVTVGRREGASLGMRKQGSIAARLLHHAMAHRMIFLTLGGAVMLAGLGTALARSDRWSIFDDDLTVMHPRPNAPLDTQRRLAELFQVSPDSLVIHLQADSADALTALAHRVDRRIRGIASQQSDIVGSFGLASLLPDPQTAADQRNGLVAEQVVANFESALADSVFNPAAFDGYKDFLRRLAAPGDRPGIADLRRYPGLAETVLPRVDLSAPQTSVFESLITIVTSRPLSDRASRDGAIDTLRGAITDCEGATLTGLTVIGHDTEQTIRRDLRKLLGIAAGIVILWLVIYFRSVRAAVLAFVPALFGFVMVLATMRLCGVKLNTINLIALPLLVGIGVDDGIFLVAIVRRARARGAAATELISRLSAGCHAITMTSLTTIVTFGTLAFTSTPAIRSLGVLMAVGVTAGLIGAVWILAPLLARRSTEHT